MVVDHGGRTQICGGSASEPEICSLAKVADFTPPHLHWDFVEIFGIRKLESLCHMYGIVSVILSLTIFVQLRLVTDRRMDKQTNRQTDTVLA